MSISSIFQECEFKREEGLLEMQRKIVNCNKVKGENLLMTAIF